MSAATTGFWAGAVLAILFGYQLGKAAITDTIWVRKMGKTPKGWRIRYWQMSRSENPRAFWVNIALMSAFFMFGLFLAGWALISPETLH